MLHTAYKKDTSLKINHMFTQYVEEDTVLLTMQKIASGFVIFWAIFSGSVIIGFYKIIITIMHSKNKSYKNYNND
jgi:hypothetical protein